jgi:hypothetical protein
MFLIAVLSEQKHYYRGARLIELKISCSLIKESLGKTVVGGTINWLYDNAGNRHNKKTVKRQRVIFRIVK